MCYMNFFLFLMVRRPPRSTQSRSSAASDVYKIQAWVCPARRGLPCIEWCRVLGDYFSDNKVLGSEVCSLPGRRNRAGVLTKYKMCDIVRC